MTDRDGGEAVVAGLGMVAALGADVRTNCAAARAGLNRARSLEHYRIRSEVEGDEEPVIGHQAGLLTRGFERDARLMRLAQGALADLRVQSPGIDWSRRRHSFYVSLPDSRRVQTGIELIADEDAQRRRIEVQRQEAASAVPSNADRAARIFQRAATLTRWPVEPVIAFASFAGHAGGLEAVRAAVLDLKSGETEVAIVVGVDSFLDQDTLEWLNLCGRLKSDGSPSGFQPGEAGAAMALSSQGSVPPRSRSTVLDVVSVASEKRTLLSGASAAGEALAAVVAQSWQGRGDDRLAWIISDQNGEIYRATDWGYACVRLRSQFDAFAEPVVWYPAISFGDTGAASAMIGVCTAVRAWERRYAPTESAIVAAASDGEARAALRIASSGSLV